MPSDIQQHLVVTAVSYNIEWMQPEANRKRIAQLLSTLPPSDMIVLPETFTTGFGLGMEQLAEPSEGITLQWMQEMAAKQDAMMVGSWIVGEGGECHNRMHLVMPNGEWHTYDKAHTFRVSGEADIVARGKEKRVVEWRGWRLRPAVCYDLRFPTWLRNSNEPDGRMGYDVLVVCANWPNSRQHAWNILLKARAIENLSYVVGCNRTGADNGGATYDGGSCLINYRGEILESKHNAAYVSATLDHKALMGFRERWPFNLDFD